jgi:hypothetical protein
LLFAVVTLASCTIEPSGSNRTGAANLVGCRRCNSVTGQRIVSSRHLRGDAAMVPWLESSTAAAEPLTIGHVLLAKKHSDAEDQSL